MDAFISQPIPDVGVELLTQAGVKVRINPEERPLRTPELIALAKGALGLMCMWSDPITSAVLEALPTVRCVSNFGVGFNNIDVAACTARKIPVTNTPGVLTNATAEIAWALIFMCARRTSEGERLVRSEEWKGWGPKQLLGTDINGKTLGIIGAGRIGEKVALMGRGMDMPVVYFGRRDNELLKSQLGAKRIGLEELLGTADIVSINTPLTPETRHLIGAAQLALMKRTAILINTARGPIVDEAALVEALRKKTIMAAGLDVYEKEPVLHPDLYELENAVVLPHLGSATTATRDAMATTAAKNLIAMLKGQRPAHPVNAELWN